MKQIRIALSQINSTVGDLAGNIARIIESIQAARARGANIISFPELAITGYPPEDLLLKAHFVQENLTALERIAREAYDIIVIVGFVDLDGDIFDAAGILADGKIAGKYHKCHLPNYGVFDENRYFQAGYKYPVFQVDGITFGVTICEDIWYSAGPAEYQALLGDAEILFNISASPYEAAKIQARQRMLSMRAYDSAAVVSYTNLIGGQDELVFDGSSMVFNERGELLARAKSFEEDLLVVDVDTESVFRRRLHDPRRRHEKEAAREMAPRVQHIKLETELAPPSLEPEGHVIRRELEPDEEVYGALLLGTRDYVRKNGFEKVVIGLSGGLDSSLTAAVAVDALGAENVVGVRLPSQYSSDHSLEDAQALADNLDIKTFTIPIHKAFDAYQEMLADIFSGLEPDVAEENLQARIRGNILMALSNKFGWLVLTTGNKSEVSVGYCTLYGDMAGGYSVLKDISKTLAYRLCRYKNRIAGRDLIPNRVLEKPPSAELRPDQKDSDSLPEYEVLDKLLHGYVEEYRSFEELVQLNSIDVEALKKVIRLVDSNEYKRRQAAPGIKISHRAFGKDWRLPITNRFKEF